MQAINLSNKFSIYRRSILIIVMLSIVFFLQSCGAHNKHGAATPIRVVEQYLTALEERNDNVIRRLMPEQSIAIKDIDAKIAKFGGYKIRDRIIKYIKFKPILWNAKIHGFYIDRAGINRKFEDSIEIEYQSKGELKLYAGRWYLVSNDKV
jgi:hypothetical protein